MIVNLPRYLYVCSTPFSRFLYRNKKKQDQLCNSSRTAKGPFLHSFRFKTKGICTGKKFLANINAHVSKNKNKGGDDAKFYCVFYTGIRKIYFLGIQRFSYEYLKNWRACFTQRLDWFKETRTTNSNQSQRGKTAARVTRVFPRFLRPVTGCVCNLTVAISVRNVVQKTVLVNTIERQYLLNERGRCWSVGSKEWTNRWDSKLARTQNKKRTYSTNTVVGWISS